MRFKLILLILMVALSVTILSKTPGEQMTHDILMSLEKAGFDTTDDLGTKMASDINKTVNRDMSALVKNMNSLATNINSVVAKHLQAKSSPEELTNELLKISDEIVKKSMILAQNLGPDLIKVINSNLETNYPNDLEKIDLVTSAILENIDKQLSPVIKKIGNITPIVLKNINAIVKEYSRLGPEISDKVLNDLQPLIKNSSNLGNQISNSVISNLDIGEFSESIPAGLPDNIDLQNADMDEIQDMTEDLSDSLSDMDIDVDMGDIDIDY